MKFIRDRYCTTSRRKLCQDKIGSKECTLYPPTIYLNFYHLIQVCVKIDLHEQV
jgi:hypothetical protein